MRSAVRLTAKEAWSALLVGSAVFVASTMSDVGTGFVRFDLPKELALHLAVVVMAAIAVARADRSYDGVDRGAGVFLLALVPGALLASVPALALRQGALTTSLVALFVLARRAPALAATAAIVSTVVLAASGVGEALGLFSLSAPGFAPGGLVGQRNHLAHAAALGLALLFTLRASTTRQRAVIGALAALLSAAVLLTRCRAGYLAAGTAALAAMPLLRDGSSAAGASLLGTLAGAALGAAAPLGISWSVENPYVDSASRMFEVSRGSGEVRVDEARATLRLAWAHPLLGLGPGNWTSAYASVLPSKARALALADGSIPRLSHVDLVARVAEAGLVGAMGAAVWLASSVRSLARRASLGRAAPFFAALIVVELLDAGISIPATGLVAALGAASLFPLDATRPLDRASHAGLAATASALALAAAIHLLQVRAADRAFVTEESPSALVAACEADGAAATHCVEAARRALVLGDRSGANRAVRALERTYPAHPILSDLKPRALASDDAQR